MNDLATVHLSPVSLPARNHWAILPEALVLAAHMCNKSLSTGYYGICVVSPV